MRRTLGAADGRHEADADRIARQAIHQDHPFSLPPALRRTEDLRGEPVRPDVEESLQQILGDGQPLAAQVRGPMERALGADFSQVKVHTDARSDSLSRSLQAQAFTTGSDLFFRQGEYDPHSSAGQHLIAHELAHVVQQTGNPAPPIQRREYFPDEAKPPEAADVRYMQVTVKGVVTPRRMEARGLAKKNVGGGTSRGRFDPHSGLYTRLAPLFKDDVLHDMHLLHEELGGKAVPINLVPGPQETNNNMMDFERMVISRVKQTSIDQSFRVVDYEVGVNYGRSGAGDEAAMPTSLDMRMTEQRTEDKGASWLDDGPTLVRNVAVRPKTVFAAGNAPDRTRGPVPETAADPLRPFLAPKNPGGRVLHSSFVDAKTAAADVDPSSLYHFRDHGLISDQLEDPRYTWTRDKLQDFFQWYVANKLRDYITEMLNEYHEIATHRLSQLALPPAEKERLGARLNATFKENEDFRPQKIFETTRDGALESISLADGKPFGRWPIQSIQEFASFWPERILEGIEDGWHELEDSYRAPVQAPAAAVADTPMAREPGADEE